MDSSDSVQKDLEDLRASRLPIREAAAERVFARYWEKLVTLAFRNLAHRYSTTRNEEDIAQSALKSFLWRYQDGRFVVQNQDELWRLLVTIVLNKVRKHCRDARREAEMTQPLVTGGSGASAYPDWLFDHLATSERTAEDALDLSNAIQSLPINLQTVLLRFLEGYKKQEIAEQLGCAGETVRTRWLEALEELAKRYGCHVVYLAARFHSLWDIAFKRGEKGKPPDIADFICEIEPVERGALLQSLLATDVSYRRKRGEAPRPEEYQQHFPEFAAIIQGVFDCID